MRTQKEDGFTIIEVTIFLAITALMIMVALAGTSRGIASARFTDSVRSFESFMQRQYDETLNGVNSRAGTETCNADGSINQSLSSVPGSSNKCILLGKYIYFTPGSSVVKVYYVVGLDEGILSSDLSDAEAILAVKPHIVQAANVQEYEVPWGALIHGARRDDGPANSDKKTINSILLLRSPKSSSIYTYNIHAATAPAALTNTDITSLLGQANLHNQSNICVKSQDFFPVFGAVTIAKNGRGQDAIGTRMDIDRNSSELEALCVGEL